MSALSHSIRRTAARLSPDPTPDGELLSRFLTSRDEAAFTALVRRHGKMVFGTCRRVLGNAADADDAFQAVFVVLVRKAHSLTDRTCVGNFLYATAVLTARKARTMATRRRANEAKAVRSESVEATSLDDGVTQVLDEELAGLPDKYREPVVLCELDGVSRKEAAARLGIPEGTISSRLATAHRMLAKRLASRGFTAVAVAAVLGRQAFAVSDALADAAVQAVTDGPPAAVTQLVSEVTKMLLWNKLRAGVAVLAGLLLMLGVGAGLVPSGGANARANPRAPVPEKKDEDLLQGSWQGVDAEGDGKKAPEEALKSIVFRFKGNEVTLPGDKVLTFELDPKAKPKGLTFTLTDGPQKGMKVDSAIYELNGDGLKLCIDWGRDGKAGTRPTDFSTAPRDGRISVTLKRVKEDKKDPAKQPDEPKTPDDAKRILGKWVQNAQATLPDDNSIGPGPQQVLTFDEKGMRNETTGERGERQTIDCRYELNPAAKPKELTLIGKDSKTERIYDLFGDSLKIAVLSGGKRPTSFDPKDIPKGQRMIVTEFTRQIDEPKKEEGKKSDEPKKDEPAWKAEFRKAYGLKDGELVRRVAPPYPDSRAEYFRDYFERLRKRRPTEAELNDEVNTFTQFNWKDGITSTGWQTRCESEGGVTLQFLLGTVAGYPRARIESDEALLQRKITGDFITRTGADPEKLAVQLEAILRKECDLPVKLSLKDVEEEGFILSGTYAAKPLEDRKANEIEVYAFHLTDRKTGGGGNGTFKEFTASLERHVNRSIVLGKIEGEPKLVRWHDNVRFPPILDHARGIDTHAADTDPTAVLGNIAAQTGLTMKTEKRKVRKLVVEHAELKK